MSDLTKTSEPVAKLSRIVTELESKIQPYLSSFKSALAYVIEIGGEIVQLCIVFHPFNVSDQHTELYHQPETKLRIYIERLSVKDVFSSLTEFASKGVIMLGGAEKRFVYSPNDLSSSSIVLLEKERLSVIGREWSSWGMRAYCSETLEKVSPTFDFNKCYSIIRRDRGESSLIGLIRKLTHLPYLEVHSSTTPSVTILAPIYARINRCGLLKDKIKFYVETVEGLADSPHLHVNVLKFTSESEPSHFELTLNKMQLESTGEHGLHFLSYEMPCEGLDGLELDLKDLADLSRSSDTINLTWIKSLQEKAHDFSRRSVILYLSISLRKAALALWLSMPFALSAYAAWFYYINEILPDPVAAVTVAMAIATVFMAYVSKKGLDFSQTERLKPLAEEALNEFLNILKNAVETIMGEADSHKTASIRPESLEPKPNLLTVTYNEAPDLLLKLSKLLKAMSSYNVSIDPKDAKKLKTSAEKALKSANVLETKLSQKYGIKAHVRLIFH